MRIRLTGKILLTGLMISLAGGCRTTSARGVGDGSHVRGLSASASANNVAVLMTSYGDTPSYGGLFETDMDQFRQVISDPTGNYQFRTIVGQRAGHDDMMANIRSGASQVSIDGTLLVFIAAHGSQAGMIQPEGQAYTTFGYNHVLQAIQEGRNGVRFRRLVLFISACYSGSWIYSLPALDGLFQERLVITSVGPNQLSNISEATRGMYQAFQQLKDTQNATLENLIAQAQANVGNILYYAEPQAMMAEALINRPGSQAPDTSPRNDSPGGQDRQRTPSGAAEVKAITTNDINGVTLFVYSKTTASKVEMQTSQGWFHVGNAVAPQAGFDSVFSTSVDSSWANMAAVRIRVTSSSGEASEIEVPIEHR